MAWLSALSETTTSFLTRSKMSRRCTASCPAFYEKDEQIEITGMRGRSCPPHTSIRRRGERMKSLNRYRGTAHDTVGSARSRGESDL